MGIVFEDGRFPEMIEPPERVPCPVIYKTLPVHHDGSVRLCCLDGTRATDMGNIFADGVRGVWHGEEFAKARYYHETGQWDKVPFCTNCNGWAQYEYEEEVRDGLLIRRSPEYVYYNTVNRIGNWKGVLLGGDISRPGGTKCNRGIIVRGPRLGVAMTPRGAQRSTSSARVPLTGLPLLIFKLRTGGFRWLVERLHDEWQMPRTRPGQILFRAARAASRVATRPSREAGVLSTADGILYAFYDLGVAPITFDFLWFLVGAELERKRRSLSSVHAVIVPGPRDGLRKENPELERSLDPATRRGRIINLLVPACALLPTLSGVTLAGSRSQADRLVESAS